jgi:hypothetical protein
MILKNGDKIICPICNSELDDDAEDYVLFGLCGISTSTDDECGGCYVHFEAHRIDIDYISVNFK